MFFKVVAPVLAICLAVASAGLVGAPVDADMSEQGTQDALQFAVAQQNQASNDMYISQVSKVVSVQKQVVAGLKYIFTVEMARTSCRKGGVEEVCAIHSDPDIAQPRQCKLVVWSRPWLQEIKVIENTCM